MEDIKVGDYVRTKKYGIKKIEHLAVNPNVTVNKYRYYLGLDKDGDRCYGVLKTTDIIKHSPNVIDLIEAGDYVNGEKIGQIENGFLWYGWSTEIDDYSTFFKEKDIKSIVTKEMFSSVEYRVENN